MQQPLGGAPCPTHRLSARRQRDAELAVAEERRRATAQAAAAAVRAARLAAAELAAARAEVEAEEVEDCSAGGGG